MSEKICGHCGNVLLVGLQYCPGCLRAIEIHQGDNRKKEKAAATISPPDDGISPAETFLLDLEAISANITHPVKSLYCRALNYPAPQNPPPMPAVYSPGGSRASSQVRQAQKLAFSSSYTRIVCPKCHRSQRGDLDLAPADMIRCPHCEYSFPGSFAAEFRKGADLECVRCGVITFCVSGLRVTTCPNCLAGSKKTYSRNRTKPKIVGIVVLLTFIYFFAQAVSNQTTPQFFMVTFLTALFFFFGFVTMAALGF